MLQPGSFDQVRQTISALAGYGAADRQVMSVALLSVGVCHVVTGLALRPAAWPGRVLLMAGGVATVLVAAFPVRAGAGRSVPHTVAAAVAFIALAAWPAVGGRRGAGLPWGLRAGVAAGASAALFGLLGWVLPGVGRGGLAGGPGRAGGRGSAGAMAACGGHHVLLEPVRGPEACRQPCDVTQSPHATAAGFGWRSIWPGSRGSPACYLRATPTPGSGAAAVSRPRATHPAGPFPAGPTGTWRRACRRRRSPGLARSRRPRGSPDSGTGSPGPG